MGGGAPAVSANGDLWVETGNGLLYASKHAYDQSDAVLDISPSLKLVQFFAPANWQVYDSDDLDMSAQPVLLPDGQVILSGKSQVVYLLNGSHLGGVGHQQAELNLACTTNIDGGHADAGMIVYLPCTGGTIAVKAVSSPPALHLLWTATVGGGPPIVAAGLVWTIGQNGRLYGLDPATGKARQQATIGLPANHFPTPGIGAGLMLAPSARNVIAFRTTAAGIGQGAGAVTPVTSAGPGTSGRVIAAVVLACLVAVGAPGCLIWFIRRQRRA